MPSTAGFEHAKSTAGQALLLLGGFGAGLLCTLWWQQRKALKLADEDSSQQSPASSLYGTPSITPRASMTVYGDNGSKNGAKTTLLALVVWSDPTMVRGKLARLSAHAALSAYRRSRKQPVLRSWEQEGWPKVCLRVESEEDLVQLKLQCEAQGVPCPAVSDTGQDGQLGKYVLAIGPGDRQLIRQLTQSLVLW